MTTARRRSKTGPRPAAARRGAGGRSGARRAPAGLARALGELVRAWSRPRRRADLLASLLGAMAATRVPDRMAERILEFAAEWIGGEAWGMLAVNEGHELQWLADRGIARARRAAMGAAAERAVHRGQVMWSVVAAPGGAAARLVAIPIKNHGRPVAVMVGAEPAPGGTGIGRLPTRAELARLAGLTEAMGGALDTALRLRRANALSTIDDLTGLYNSRFLNAALRREVKRACRNGRVLSLLFVDLDGFKGINDRYGHLYGSRALVEAAERIASAARETDIVARFGGDEFAIVLQDADREGAMLVARRVRDRVAGTPFLAAAGINFPLTASVGAATLPPEGGTPEALLAAADTAMYRVKSRGKNGFEMAELLAPSHPE